MIEEEIKYPLYLFNEFLELAATIRDDHDLKYLSLVQPADVKRFLNKKITTPNGYLLKEHMITVTYVKTEVLISDKIDKLKFTPQTT